MNVTIPLEVKHEEVTGNKKKKHYIRIGDFQLPIWGFKQPDYEAIHTDTSENPVYFFKWKLPIKIVESVLSEKRRSEEHTSELQSRGHLVCRLLLEKKK